MHRTVDLILRRRATMAAARGEGNSGFHTVRRALGIGVSLLLAVACSAPAPQAAAPATLPAMPKHAAIRLAHHLRRLAYSVRLRRHRLRDQFWAAAITGLAERRTGATGQRPPCRGRFSRCNQLQKRGNIG